METKAIVLKNSNGAQFAIVDCRNRNTGEILEAASEAISEEYGNPVKRITFGSWGSLIDTGSTYLSFMLDDCCDGLEEMVVEQTWIY
jgi:hypothetical protein